MNVPAHPLPEPLRASEYPSFTHYSVVVRLPEIARRTLAENDFPLETAAKIETLIAEIPQGKIRAVDTAENRIDEEWNSYIQPFLGLDWLEIPWFFAEEYFYLRILEATGYFGPGAGRQRDPYAHQKQLGLDSTRADIAVLAAQTDRALALPHATYFDSLERLLLADLWGNQNDLSLWPVQKPGDGQALTGGSAAVRDHGLAAREKEGTEELHAAREHLLADDSPALIEYLSGFPAGQARVDLLLDNAGYELAADLALADFLLASQLAGQVVLHGKPYPVFVSDALEQDIHNTLDFLLLSSHGPAWSMAVRLRRRLVDGRLKLCFDPFWVSPLAGWEMPEALAGQVDQSDLLVSKGDANYRRLLGDRHWPIDRPFQAVVNYFTPAVLALRTLKSEIAVGIPPSQVPDGDPNWMSNGRWGVIQFAPPASRKLSVPDPML